VLVIPLVSKSTAVKRLPNMFGSFSRYSGRMIVSRSLRTDSRCLLLYILTVLFRLTLLLRRFILATESFGAHFGPTFIKYFNTQNELIDRGELDGEKVVVTHLMISE
jgi:hypothetical protein